MNKDSNCNHDKVTPKYNDKDLELLPSDEIRQKFPRFNGICPDCGDMVIAYSSFTHYVAGDW